LPKTNTLAYFFGGFATKEKVFVTLTPERDCFPRAPWLKDKTEFKSHFVTFSHIQSLEVISGGCDVCCKRLSCFDHRCLSTEHCSEQQQYTSMANLFAT
jgi:hypothetical protein